MKAPTTQFIIPDCFSKFPWSRKLSDLFPKIKAESDAWAESFHPFDEEGLAGLKEVDCSLLGCLVYSTLDKNIMRLGCDLMVLNFVIDEYTDVTDGNGANNIRQIVMDVLLNSDKERPDGEHVIGVMFKDFWTRASDYVPPGADCLKRFTDDFNDYTAAVVKEAKIRAQRRYSSFEDYLKLRLYTIGCFTTYTLCEFGLDLPEAVLSHPRIVDLREKAAILTGITNDIYSFPMEKSRGGGLELHNSVELVMAEQNLDVQTAINWLERYLAGVVAAFLEDIDQMPSWGKEVDQRVKIYINAIAQATRGIDDWCFECGRYFGRKGLEIQKTRVMTMSLLTTEGWQPLVKD